MKEIRILKALIIKNSMEKNQYLMIKLNFIKEEKSFQIMSDLCRCLLIKKLENL